MGEGEEQDGPPPGLEGYFQTPAPAGYENYCMIEVSVIPKPCANGYENFCMTKVSVITNSCAGEV